MLKNKTVILGVTGGIAAYKIASLASMLVKNHAEVHVLMTENATQFITPLTFETLTGHKCIVDTFDRDFDFSVEHVELAKAADAILIAPATANTIAKLSYGIADNMLLTTVLATKAPVLVSPAMNTRMIQNPITRDNIAKCASYGMEIIPAASGRLACGDDGEGKMPEPDVLFSYLCKAILREHNLVGKKVLVTAGPTQEALDPVRFLTNHSSGKMGYAIAEEAAYRGADVVLVSGPVHLTCPSFIRRVDVVSALNMYDAVIKEAEDADIVIKAAAVGDYRAASVADEKIKKSDEMFSVSLEKNPDILKHLGEHKKPGQFLCGFSMETQSMVENSMQKLKKKHLDMIVANNVKVEGAGFAGDTNVVTFLTQEGTEELPMLSKAQVAKELLDRIVAKM